MPTFRVILSRRITPSRYGMPEPNPFLASLPAPGKGATHVLREWVFEAKDEAEIKKLLDEARAAGIANVQGFSLQSIERIVGGVVVTEGTLKKNLNDPPTSPRPPAPRAQVAPR